VRVGAGHTRASESKISGSGYAAKRSARFNLCFSITGRPPYLIKIDGPFSQLKPLVVVHREPSRSVPLARKERIHPSRMSHSRSESAGRSQMPPPVTSPTARSCSTAQVPQPQAARLVTSPLMVSSRGKVTPLDGERHGGAHVGGLVAAALGSHKQGKQPRCARAGQTKQPQERAPPPSSQDRAAAAAPTPRAVHARPAATPDFFFFLLTKGPGARPVPCTSVRLRHLTSFLFFNKRTWWGHMPLELHNLYLRSA